MGERDEGQRVREADGGGEEGPRRRGEQLLPVSAAVPGTTLSPRTHSIRFQVECVLLLFDARDSLAPTRAPTGSGEVPFRWQGEVPRVRLMHGT
jgi:hypothetical protein